MKLSLTVGFVITAVATIYSAFFGPAEGRVSAWFSLLLTIALGAAVVYFNQGKG